MLRTLFFWTLLLSFSYAGHTQQVDWLKAGGGISYDGGLGITVDEAGNSYSTGGIYISYDYPKWGNDTIWPWSRRLLEGYIVKHDYSGNNLWTVSFGGTGNDIGSDIEMLSDSTFILVGSYTSIDAKFDTINAPAPNNEGVIFIAKYDTSGHIYWLRTAQVYKGVNTAPVNNRNRPKVSVSANGDIVLSVSYKTSIKFGSTTLTGGSSYHSAFASYDKDGNLKWAKSLISKSIDRTFNVTSDASGNFYTSGNFFDTLKLGNVTLTTGGTTTSRIFVAKFDTAGNAVWAKKHGTNNFDEAFGIAVDKFNHLFVSGRFNYTVKFGTINLSTNTYSGNSWDNYVVMFDTSGTAKWAKAFGGLGTPSTSNYNDRCFIVGVDNQGNAGLSGMFGASLGKFGKDTVLGANAAPNIFISLVDSSGNFKWTVTGTSQTFLQNLAEDIAIDTSNNVYVTAAASPPFVFSGKLHAFGAGNTDAFIVKITDCSDADTAEIYSGVTQVCVGDSVKLWSNNDPNLKYQWLGNGGPLFLQTDSVYNAKLKAEYSVLVSDEGCLDTSQSIKVTINPLPTVSISSFPSICLGQSNVTLNQGIPKGGIYKGKGITSDSIFNPNFAGLGTHSITYVYSDSIGCTDSATKSLGVGGTTAYFAALSAVCENAPSYKLTGGFPLGGRYVGPGMINDSIFDPGVAGSGAHNIHYVYTDFGCSDTATQTIQVDSTPGSSLSGVPVQCVSTFSVSLLPYGSPSGGVYFGSAVIGSNFYPSISGTGTFAVGYTNNNGQCPDTAYTTVMVGAPTSSLDTFPNVCFNDSSFTLSGGLPVGGTYYINNTGFTVFNPAFHGVGNHEVKYVISSCGADTSTKYIQVDSIPNVILSSLSPICAGAPGFSLGGGSPSGGVFSGTGVSLGGFSPSTAGAGTHTITYTYSDANSCSNKAVQPQLVHAQPTVSLAAIAHVCIDNGLVALSGGAPTPGTYSGNGVVGSNFNPASTGIGTHTITYKHSDSNGCTDSSTNTIQVFGLPTVNLSNQNDVCIDQVKFTLSGGSPSGGTFSGSGVSAGMFDPAIAGIGTHAITYKFTDSKGCSDTSVKSITVNPLPTVSFGTLTPVCENAQDFSLNTGSPSGGIYTGFGVFSGDFSPSSAKSGTHLLSYIFTDTNNCTNSDTSSQVVYGQPTVSFTSLGAICIDNGILTLSGGSPISGTYSGKGVSGVNFNPVVAGIGTHSIKYSYTDSNNCQDSASKWITVNPLPTVSFGPLNPVCSNLDSLVLSGGSPGSGIYSGTGVSSGSFKPNIAGVGTHTISYSFTDSNNCSNSDTSIQVVNLAPSVSMASLSSVCAGSQSFAIAGGSPGGGTYSGTGVSSNVFSPSIAGSGFHWVTYTLIDTNSCSDTASSIIQVYAQPMVTLSSMAGVCINTPSFNLAGGSPSGGSYRLNGATTTSVNPGSLGIGTHTISYVYTDLNACTDSATQNLTVDSTPTVVFSRLANLCFGAPVFTLKAATPVGGKYSGTGVINDTIFSSQLAGPGSYSIKYVYENSKGCKDSASQSILVDTLPQITFSLNDSICANADSLLLTTQPSGGQFSGSGVSGNYFNPGIVSSGYQSISYSMVGGNGCTNNVTDSIRVDSVTSLSFSLFDSICANASPVMLAGGLPLGGNYSGTQVLSGIYTPTLLGNATDTVKYTFTNAFGCSDSVAESVRVDSVAVVAFSSISPMCENESMVLSGGAPLGGNYSGKNVSGGIFSPADTGLYRLQYKFSNSFGCSDSSFSLVRVNELPQVNLTTLGSVCLNTPYFKLNNGTPTGGKYKGRGVLNDSLYNPVLVGVGNDTLKYVFVDSNGCSDSNSIVVTIDSVPIVSLDSLPIQCIEAASYRLSQGQPSGGVYYGVGVVSNEFHAKTAGYGNFKLKYVYTNSRMCSDSAFRNVVVDSILKITSLIQPDVCEGQDSVKLKGGIPSGGKYFGAGVFEDTLFSATQLKLGSTTLHYTLASECGMDTSSVVFRINGNPVITLDSLPPFCISNETSIELSNGLPKGGTYLVNGKAVTQVDVLPNKTKYYFEYQYTDSNLCQSSKTQFINVFTKPIPTIGGDTSFCQGDSLKLFANRGMKFYIWNKDTTGMNFSLPFYSVPLGTSSVTLKVVDVNGCSNESNYEITTKNCGLEFSLYPNPNNGQFTLRFEGVEEEKIQVTIYDSRGRTIVEHSALTRMGYNAMVFNMKKVFSGVYVLKIEIGEQVYFERITIQR
ncbi:MAG: hypothetical protein CL840_19680 [Crocinitomicaceae bacterium]|nr:hypothetical protein [Crocinitomicaceae bacterium]|tara:strand:+ start:18433 stop:25083 length:6651 start_codon:yes stop_codon:yes gene_type:complete